MTQKIVPVIMAGGKGTRLWPLSRSAAPKQFIQLRRRHHAVPGTP
jgi:mannose-1-phosphate guanylyltransferase